jgi:hypothetical protein
MTKQSYSSSKSQGEQVPPSVVDTSNPLRTFAEAVDAKRAARKSEIDAFLNKNAPKEPVAGWAPGPWDEIMDDRGDDLYSAREPTPAQLAHAEETLKRFIAEESAARAKRLNDLKKLEEQAHQILAGTDMGFGAKQTSTPVDDAKAINGRLDDISAQVSRLAANLNKVPKEPLRIELGFTDHDMREFERVLDELEQAHTTIKTPHKIDVPVGRVNLDDYLEREATMAKNRTGWITEPDGTRKHYNKDGVLHMEGAPAEVRTNGTQLYYQHGSLHRDGNEPAMRGARGTEKYAVHGKYHRLGGLPAITWSKGPYRHEWWVDGQCLRAQRKDGTQEWYAPGCEDREEAILHRTDGPAVIHTNGKEEFWINGQQFPGRESWLGALSRMHEIQKEALEDELIDEDPIEVAHAADEDMVETKRSPKVSQAKEKKMEKASFTDKLKANAVSAGYRVAGTQLTTLIKNAILTVMRNKGADGGAVAAFSAFLDTEFGNAMISFAIGSGLQYVPIESLREDERVIRLAEEMSVAGMAIAGNAIIGEAMQHVLPAVSQILQNLPSADPTAASNVRVIESTEQHGKLAESLEEEESETEETVAKTMKA